MKHFLPDTNVWLACAISGHPHHAAARTWLDAVESTDAVLLCRPVQISLLRLLTTTAVLAPYGDPPLTNEEAWAVHDAFLTDSRISQLAVEPPGTSAVWRSYSDLTTASPKRWMDAYLAALSTTAKAVLVTTDAAFRSYPELDPIMVRN